MLALKSLSCNWQKSAKGRKTVLFSFNSDGGADYGWKITEGSSCWFIWVLKDFCFHCLLEVNLSHTLRYFLTKYTSISVTRLNKMYRKSSCMLSYMPIIHATVLKILTDLW
jgi:hypothetical protein